MPFFRLSDEAEVFALLCTGRGNPLYFQLSTEMTIAIAPTALMAVSTKP